MSDLHVSKQNYTMLKKMFFDLVSTKIIENYIIVITGDLTDNGDLTDTKRVKSLLRILSSAKAVLIVPGNHDYFTFLGNGFFPCKKCKKKFNLDYYGKEFDKFPRMDTFKEDVFIGLNSAHPSFFASGKIGNVQLQDLEILLNSEKVKTAKNVIVYFHHHPFQISKRWWEFWKFWKDKVMELQDSKQLLKILNNSNVNIVLFGHKHSKMGEHKIKNSNIRFYNAGSTSGKDKESAIGFSLIEINEKKTNYTKRERFLI